MTNKSFKINKNINSTFKMLDDFFMLDEPDIHWPPRLNHRRQLLNFRWTEVAEGNYTHARCNLYKHLVARIICVVAESYVLYILPFKSSSSEYFLLQKVWIWLTIAACFIRDFFYLYCVSIALFCNIEVLLNGRWQVQ